MTTKSTSSVVSSVAKPDSEPTTVGLPFGTVTTERGSVQPNPSTPSPGPVVPPSRYTVRCLSDGFVVEGGADRVPVKVGLEPQDGLLILVSPVEGEGEGEGKTGYSFRPQTLGLYDFKGLLSAVASGLMASWRPNNLLPFPSPFSPIFASSFVASTTEPDADLDPNATPAANAPAIAPKRPWSGVSQWAYAQTAKALYPRLYREWQHLLESVDPHKLKVIRAVSLANYGSTSPGPETWPELYAPQYAYLRADIERFRAAAIACRRASELVLAHRGRAVMREAHYLELRGQAQQEEARLRAAGIDPTTVQPTVEIEFVPGYPLQWPLAPTHERYLWDELAGIENNRSVIMAGLVEWRSLFSSRGDGRSYRSLNRSLTHLPGGIPPRLLGALGAIELERPVTDRVDLLTLLLYANLYQLRSRRERALPDHLPLFMHATRSHIETALGRFAAHTQQPPLKAKTRPLEQLVGFLTDYPYEHRGNLVGLTERAIEWHRALNEPRPAFGNGQGQGDLSDLPAADTPLARPPIELPAPQRRVKGSGLEVRFLATVGDILEEGRVMGHCIASYTHEALAGECYLFHVEYRGEKASVQVDESGYIRQSFGPLNRRNEASEGGRQALTCWGRQLRVQAAPKDTEFKPFARLAHQTHPNAENTNEEERAAVEAAATQAAVEAAARLAMGAGQLNLWGRSYAEGFDSFLSPSLDDWAVDLDEAFDPADLPF